MKQRIFITSVICVILLLGLVGVRHIDRLNDGIKLKEIEIQDNSLRLELLDKKYDQLYKDLEQTGADKAKVEEQLKQLQIERDKLQKDLQAKIKAKEADIAAKAQKAAVAAISTSKAYAATCGDNEYANKIYMQESGCNLTSTNSIGCTGLGQSCPSSKLSNACPNWRTDYGCQNRFFTSYAMSYGGWKQAYDFKYCLGSCYSTRTKITVLKKSIWW